MALGIDLRPEGPGDEGFVRRLGGSAHTDLVAAVGADDPLVELQWRAQEADWTTRFPAMERSIVEADGSAIGRLYLDRAPGAHRIVDIALVPEARGRGIGTALLRRVQAEAADAHASLRLAVARTNPAAALYRRLGFRVVSSTPLHHEMVWP